MATWNVVSASSTVIRLLNSDLTITEITGTGFVLDGSNNATAGTVSTSVLRFAADGTTLLETITGVNIALATFQSSIATDVGTALSGSDTVNGSAASEILFGGAGSDQFAPGDFTLDAFGRGGDQMVGGAGNDTFTVGPGNVSFYTINYALETGPNAITVNLATNTATDTFGNSDSLVGIVSVTGTALNDTFTGDSTGDFFAPGGGNDVIDGGGGFDSLEYASNAFYNLNAAGFPDNVGISVTHTGDNAGTVIDPLGGTDTFTNVERIRGTNYNDTFGGSAFDDSFRGYGGNDTFNGGGGFDEVDYRGDASRGATSGVTVNLATNSATDGFGATDQLNSIEQVFGTQFADTIIGDGLGNFLGGDAGNDSLNGGGGDDSLRGGAGNDTINGGNGYDRADYRNEGGGGITVTMTGSGAGTVVDTYGNTDTLIDIEAIFATDFADTLNGSATNDDFRPGRGSDALNAGSGGFDSVNYLNDNGATSGVNVNFQTGQVTSVYFGTDTLSGVWEHAFGTQNNDTLTGANGNAYDEWFSPSLGVDVVAGGTNAAGFRDALSMNDFRTNGSGSGVTFAVTGSGAGTVTGTGINVTFTGIELLSGGALADVFNGGASTMSFRGLGGIDVFNGAANGFETVDYAGDAQNGGTAGVVVNLGAGVGTDGFGNSETLVNIDGVNGTDVNDTLTGNAGANVLNGNGGDDLIFDGGAGTDTLNGGLGNDFLIASADNDLLFGGGGNDGLYGGAGLDLFLGGSGNDFVSGGEDRDIAYGEAGQDVLLGEGGDDFLVEGDDSGWAYGGTGSDVIFAGSGDDIASGDADRDWVYGDAGQDAVFGGAGDDVVDGGDDRDYVLGEDGADAVFGGAGDDVVFGGNGNDYLVGGVGYDFIYGGAGLDVFASNAATDGFDWIMDFNNTTEFDQIWLVGSGYASGAAALAAGFNDGAGNLFIPTASGAVVVAGGFGVVTAGSIVIF